MQLGFDPLPVLGDQAHIGVEDSPARDAQCPRLLQRQIGAPQKHDRVVAVFRHRDNTHRNADRLQMRLELIGFHHQFDELFDQLIKLNGCGTVRQQHAKLAGADPPDLDAFRQVALQPFCKQLDELVALLVADGIVDVFESVYVDIDEIDRLSGTSGSHCRLGDLADHRGPRIEPGQFVELGFAKNIARRFIDTGKEGERRTGCRQRAKGGNDGADHLGRHACDLIAHAVAQPPQTDNEAAQTGSSDGQQAEDRCTKRMVGFLHVICPIRL